MPTEEGTGDGMPEISGDGSLKGILDGGALPVPLAVRTLKSLVDKLLRDPTRVGAVLPKNVLISDREGLLITIEEEIALAKLRPEDAPYLTVRHDPEATLSAQAAMVFSLGVIFYQMLIAELPQDPMDFDSITSRLRRGIRRERSFGLPVVELGRLLENILGAKANLSEFRLEDLALALADINSAFSEVALSSHKALGKVQSVGTGFSGAGGGSEVAAVSADDEDVDKLTKAVLDPSANRSAQKSRPAFASFGVEGPEAQRVSQPQDSRTSMNFWTVRGSQQAVSPREGVLVGSGQGQLFPAGGETPNVRKRSPSGNFRTTAAYGTPTVAIEAPSEGTPSDSGRIRARSQALFGTETSKDTDNPFEVGTSLFIRISLAILLSLFVGFLAILITDRSWQELKALSAFGWSPRLGFISAAHCLWFLLLSTVPVLAFAVSSGFSASTFRFLFAGFLLNTASFVFFFLFHIMRFDRLLTSDERVRDMVSWVSILEAVRKNLTELTYMQPVATRYVLDDKFVDPVYSVSFAPDIAMQLIYAAMVGIYVGFFISLFRTYALRKSRATASGLVTITGFFLYVIEQALFTSAPAQEWLKRFNIQVQAFEATLSFNAVYLACAVGSVALLAFISGEVAKQESRRIA